MDGGPLHWNSIRQSITTRSSTEAEIYAIDDCVKSLQHIHNIFTDLNLSSLLPKTFTIYNNNEESIKWTANMTAKGLKHIQMKENSTREQQQKRFFIVKNIMRKLNICDMFTKEDKDASH